MKYLIDICFLVILIELFDIRADEFEGIEKEGIGGGCKIWDSAEKTVIGWGGRQVLEVDRRVGRIEREVTHRLNILA